MIQEVGHVKAVKLLNRSEIVFNHSTFRTYYMIRNILIKAKKHHLRPYIRYYLRAQKAAYLIYRYQNEKKENKKQIKRAFKDAKNYHINN